MKYVLRFVFASLFVFSLQAQADIREVFVCNYKEGKGMQDVMDARDFYVEQAKKAKMDTPPAFVWTPWKAFTGIDLLWFNVHEDFAAFAANADAGAGSEEMAAVGARFESVATCQSGLLSREVVFDGGEFEIENPPAVISSNACMMRDGVDRSDVDDLFGHARSVLGSIDDFKNHIVFASTPITPSADTPDLFIYAVHESATAMANKQAAFMASDSGPLLAKHFNATLDCGSSFWIGQPVITND